MLKLKKIDLADADFEQVNTMAACAADAVRSGLLGYSAVVRKKAMTIARARVLAISAESAVAMLYVGAYRVGAVAHLRCLLLKHGCEAVADAAFGEKARTFGILDSTLQRIHAEYKF